MNELLFAVALILLVTEIVSFRWVRKTELEYGGRPGGFVLWVVARLGLALVVAQALTLFNAVVRRSDDTMELRTIVFIAVEAVQATAFLWAAVQIRKLRTPVHTDADEPSIERGKTLEGVPVQIDDSFAVALAPVDQGDGHAPVS